MKPAYPASLPDFRNFGVMLRIALLAEAVRVIVLIATEPTLSHVWASYLGQGLLFEPVLLSSILVLAGLRPWLARPAYRQGALSVTAVTVALALGWRALLSQGLGLPVPDTVAVAAATAGLTGALLFYFNWRHQRLSPAWAESRLMALQARIRPHFLFNSLNSVLALIRQDPRRAEAMLEDLADLYRALLAEPRTLVPLAQDLQWAQSYVAVESIRLGERLQVRWLCDAAPLQAWVPPLLLQPLLENAVRHGVEPRQEPTPVSVEIYRDDGQLQLFVRNPLPSAGAAAVATEGHHLALANIRERLALHFDAEARLKAYASDGEYVVNVRLPISGEPRPPRS